MKQRTSSAAPNGAHRTSNLSSAVFRTTWGWMAIAASPRGVQAIVLPKSSRKSAEVALSGGLISSNGHLTPYAARLPFDPSTTLRVVSLSNHRLRAPSPVEGSSSLDFARDGELVEPPQASRLTVLLEEARAQLVAFLEGKRRELDFPVDLSGGSAFQRRVWRAILPIPYGRVRSYKWVALRVGGARYARAVGHALGANPVPIVIPCHRVVAHDASLSGFSGGLRMKRRLLDLEGTLPLLKR